jgi:hypothetical protein
MYRRVCIAVEKIGAPGFPLRPGTKDGTPQDWPNIGSRDPKVLRYMWTADWVDAARMGDAWKGASSEQRDALRRARDARFEKIMSGEPGPYIPFNIGMVMGGDRLAVDVDRKIGPAAQESLDKLYAEGLPRDTLEGGTTTGGSHLIFAKDPSIRLRNRTGKDNEWKRGIEIKAERGYIVGPGSVIRGKGEYKIVKDSPVVDMPVKFFEDMLDSGKVETRPPVVETAEYEDEWSIAWTKQCLSESTAEEGHRNDGLRDRYYKIRARGITHKTYRNLVIEHWPPLDTLDANKQDAYLNQIADMARWADGHGLKVGSLHPRYLEKERAETLIEAFEAFDVGEDVPPPSDDLAEKIKQANAADAERRERVAVSQAAQENAERIRAEKAEREKADPDRDSSAKYIQLDEALRKRDAAWEEYQPVMSTGDGVATAEAKAEYEKAEHPEKAEREHASANPGGGINFRDARVKRAPYVMKGWLHRGETVQWFGPPGAGKSASLLSVMLASAAAPPEGATFAGCRIKRGLAIFAAYERAGETQDRIAAAKKRLGLPDDLPFVLLTRPPLLKDSKAAESIIETIRHYEKLHDMPCSTFAVDTLTAARPGMGQSDDAEMSSLMNHLQHIRDTVGCCLPFIHHPTKANANNPRGSGVTTGHVDKEVVVNKGRVRMQKNNAGPDANALDLKIESVHMGEDEDGDPISVAYASIKPGRAGVDDTFDVSEEGDASVFGSGGVPERLKPAYTALRVLAAERPDGVVSTNDWFDRIDADAKEARKKKPGRSTKNGHKDALVEGEYVAPRRPESLAVGMTTSHFLRGGKSVRKVVRMNYQSGQAIRTTFPTPRCVRIVLNLDTESTGTPGDSVSGWFRNSDDDLDKFSDVRRRPLSLKRGAPTQTGTCFRTKSAGQAHITLDRRA